MSVLQNWSSIVRQVQVANLQQDLLQKQIKRSNQIAYKQQLDRQVELRHMQNEQRSAQKKQQLQQARLLAQAQKLARQHQKHTSTQLHRHYETQNSSLVHYQQILKSTARQSQTQHMKSISQHPFIQLVDNQDLRNQQSKQQFIRQNEINYRQQVMRNKERNQQRYRQWQQRNNFIQHIQHQHTKRSQQRQRFKHKYLKIKRQQDPTNRFALSPQSVQKTYINYLNQQINQNSIKRNQQKQQLVDPKINPFYANSSRLEPDSSPAFLGRIPLSHDRKRQLDYITKHLNTYHGRAETAGFGKQSYDRQNQYNRRSSDYVKQANRLNPQDMYGSGLVKNNDYRKRLIYQPHRNTQNQTQSIHLRSHPGMHREKVQTEMNQNKSLLNERGLSHSMRTEQKQQFETGRSMRSEVVVQSPINQSKLPQITKKMHEPAVNPVRISIPQTTPKIQRTKRSNPRQYFCYDPIMGKQVSIKI